MFFTALTFRLLQTKIYHPKGSERDRKLLVENFGVAQSDLQQLAWGHAPQTQEARQVPLQPETLLLVE